MVEIENNNAKQEGEGFTANTTKSTVFANLDRQDVRRAELEKESNHREKESIPLKSLPMFVNLYKRLFRRVMVLLEIQFQRSLKQNLIAVDPTGLSYQLQGSSKERYGIPPRIRTVWIVEADGSAPLVFAAASSNGPAIVTDGVLLDGAATATPSAATTLPEGDLASPARPSPSAKRQRIRKNIAPSDPKVSQGPALFLRCSCKAWQRFTGLPCRHILWAYHQAGKPYPLAGIHFRYYIAYLENPAAFPARKPDDNPIGSPAPLGLPAALQSLGRELEADQTRIPPPDLSDSNSDDDGFEVRKDWRPESTRIKQLIAPLVDEIWDVSKISEPVAKEVDKAIRNALNDIKEWAKNHYQMPDAAVVERQVRSRTTNKRAGH